MPAGANETNPNNAGFLRKINKFYAAGMGSKALANLRKDHF